MLGFGFFGMVGARRLRGHGRDGSSSIGLRLLFCWQRESFGVRRMSFCTDITISLSSTDSIDIVQCQYPYNLICGLTASA